MGYCSPFTSIPFVPILLVTLYVSTESKDILTLFTAYIGFLWHSLSRKSALYKSCYDSYNKYLEKCIEYRPEEKEGLDILRNSLAIDVLDFDLWAHKSFSELFIYELINSLEFLGDVGAHHVLPKCIQVFYDTGKTSASCFRLDKFQQYFEKNSLSVEDASFILNLTFQIRNVLHKSREKNVKAPAPGLFEVNVKWAK